MPNVSNEYVTAKGITQSIKVDTHLGDSKCYRFNGHHPKRSCLSILNLIGHSKFKTWHLSSACLL